ncbi:amino acid transporter [Brevibacterium aurantiacum]|uniref:Amino acid transporter n=2 Tax=Brevibacterium aurantiacum TaxID=273384 RepID=A0A2A3XA29_BREAU|nr:amino acid transporter [Brevibacterium aurantiacum]
MAGIQSRHKRLTSWLLDGLVDGAGTHQGPHAAHAAKKHPWWRVMCLSGVDYFSTLGYQPAIAALAAGLLSPLATIVLVLLTLFGALPVYRRVARESFNGSGSIAMLEHLLPWWAGKVFVLVLLGFAATDFMLTMTLSAADAAAHAIENPFAPDWLEGGRILLTLSLIAMLAVVFLKGFHEAIGIAVVLVAAYLALNLIVIAVSLVHISQNSIVITNWWTALTAQHGNPIVMVGIALLVFPKLALGLSGFETGVAVMPQIAGAHSDTPERPARRIRDGIRLLTTAAGVMSIFLIASSIVTTFLIPQEEFMTGGAANGRALAFLAHEYLGEGFGTVYDIVTICILWFAGASAMAGLLNLVPRYLPRYGMAPQWARAVRPLVLVFTGIAFVITIAFEADVDAQGGAYATGVLVLITSASVAVTISAMKRRQRTAIFGFAVITLVFVYTTILNIIERPEGIRVAGLFILGILLLSAVSRIFRSFQIRATKVTFDAKALEFIQNDARNGTVRIVAHESHGGGRHEYQDKNAAERRFSHIPRVSRIIFLQVHPTDSSEFEEDLLVEGMKRYGYRVLSVKSANVPNTIAAILLQVRDQTTVVPNAYFEWTEGNPISSMLKFLLFGTGAVATLTREVLRKAEPNEKQRPLIHVS